MQPKIVHAGWMVGLIALAGVLLIACGGSTAPAATSPPPAAPAMPAATVMSAAPAAPAAEAPAPAAPGSSAPVATAAPRAPAAAPTAVATPTPLPVGTVSARDKITLVIPEEPQNMNSLRAIGGSLYQSITRASLVDPLTWQSGDGPAHCPHQRDHRLGTGGTGPVAVPVARGGQVPQRRAVERGGGGSQPELHRQRG